MVNHTPISKQNFYILDALDPDDIVAVEIYRYSGEIPPGLRARGGGFSMDTVPGALSSTPAGEGIEYYNPQSFACGVTVFWTGAGW